MSLQRIIYCSQSTGLDQHDIDKILQVSENNNSTEAVTGMLLFNAGYFLQLLEGGRLTVTETFCRIASDPRHKNIELLSCKAVSSRLFADWSMSYVPLTGETGNLLRKYQEGNEFRPKELSESAAEDFCKACSTSGQLASNGPH